MDALIENYNKTRLPAHRGSVCHAPSVNLNFEQSGNATACCYNRRFILGRYPKNSLQEIWNGSRAKELRDLLKKGDLSQGCQLCQEQLKAENFSGLRAKSFDPVLDQVATKTSSFPMPKIMEFEISNTCNLECVMCNGYFSSSIRRNREKLEPLKSVYDDAFVEQLRPFLPYLTQTKFLGGEPFLNPMYYKIWDLIVEVNPAIDAVITTNATIMNKKVLNLLEHLRPTISISCDSLDKKTYESVRVNAKFDSFYANLQIFMQSALISRKALGFCVCPMTTNWKTIPDIFKFCNKFVICFGVNTVVWPLDLSIKTLPRKKILEIVSYLEPECSPNLRDSNKWWERYNYESYQGMLNQIRFWAKEYQANG